MIMRSLGNTPELLETSLLLLTVTTKHEGTLSRTFSSYALSLWSIFYLSFSNLIPSFHTISPHKARQDKPDARYCTMVVGCTRQNTGLQQDLQLVLLSNTRPPTETVHLPESFCVFQILSVTFPQEEESSELPCSGSTEGVNQGLTTLLSGDIMIPPPDKDDERLPLPPDDPH